MDKVLFALDVEDGYPPVGTEGVWCERIDSNYKLVNIPFFIKGLAYGDVFAAQLDGVNDHVFEFEIVEESGHSVVWIFNSKSIDTSTLERALESLGCRIEGMPQFRLHSVDVPPNVDLLLLLAGQHERWAE